PFGDGEQQVREVRGIDVECVISSTRATDAVWNSVLVPDRTHLPASHVAAVGTRLRRPTPDRNLAASLDHPVWQAGRLEPVLVADVHVRSSLLSDHDAALGRSPIAGEARPRAHEG